MAIGKTAPAPALFSRRSNTRSMRCCPSTLHYFFKKRCSPLNKPLVRALISWILFRGFAATIDTAAWVLLLLLFELETSVLSDDTLRKTKVKVAFISLRVFSYGFIGYAFYGYFSQDATYLQYLPLCRR